MAGSLPLELLLRSARREVEDDDGDAAMPSLVALQGRATREVFDRACALVVDPEVVLRELGVRILRELGDEQPDGFRPFRGETVALMRARLALEPDPGVVRWIVSALGWHRDREALPEVVALAGHPDVRVRFHVAAALPGLVDRERVEPAAAEALFRLCHDEDADIRYYALYAVTREIGGLDVEAVTALVVGLADDADEQVRAMAVAHREAIGVVRELLDGVVEPGRRERLIGPVLVELAWAEDDADLLEDLITDSDLAERLVRWWAGRD
ncbi:HEAT repeat-containing protein [Actinoplanes derwentensis]|uniref:HEAT repeat-containing protein n=1 Tax=Actinoplanes derwentensis TaxID=113562 RepID=A0A1H1WG11_9ACTN|nr:HEAT repeat-containing protein [Actinoplanes derwentensis]